jgi:hypothetical protein
MVKSEGNKENMAENVNAIINKEKKHKEKTTKETHKAQK